MIPEEHITGISGETRVCFFIKLRRQEKTEITERNTFTDVGLKDTILENAS